MDPIPGTLKAYEREIFRARSRIEVADLDNEIDRLIAIIIGKLDKVQHEAYQAARLSLLMQANPDEIVLRRALLLGLTDVQIKRLSAPDVLTMEELAALVVIMQSIAQWLKSCEDTGVSYFALVQKARKLAQEAYDSFVETYKREPSVDDVPNSLMQLSRARKIVKLAQRGKILLPPVQSESET